MSYIPEWLPICYITMNGLQLLILLSLPLNSGIAEVYYHTQLYAMWAQTQGFLRVRQELYKLSQFPSTGF